MFLLMFSVTANKFAKIVLSCLQNLAFLVTNALYFTESAFQHFLQMQWQIQYLKIILGETKKH